MNEQNFETFFFFLIKLINFFFFGSAILHNTFTTKPKWQVVTCRKKVMLVVGSNKNQLQLATCQIIVKIL